MALEIENSPATIKHINARKEGHENDKELAVDLKLEIDTFAADVLPYFDPTLRGHLFNHDAVRYPQMEVVKWQAEHVNMAMDLCGFEFIEVKLSKFELSPYIDKKGEDLDDFTDVQKVRLTLSASFKPKGREMATIAEMLGEETPISIRARQQELPV